MFSQPSYEELDILKETANIGSGQAATALSKLLGTPVRMRVPTVRVVPFDQLADSVGGAETVVLAVFFQIKGDFGGNMYVLMAEQEARLLLGEWYGEVKDKPDHLTDMDYSALAEAGNIVAGTYLSALADFTGLKFLPSVPHLTIDMAGAVLSVGAAEIGLSSDQAIMLDTAISTSDAAVSTQVILLPQPEQLPLFFQAIGVSGNGH